MTDPFDAPDAAEDELPEPSNDVVQEGEPVADQTGTVSVLTDGTGVSPIDATKLIKDFVADFLLTGAAALATANILDLGGVLAAPQVAALAVAGAAIRAGYRIVLRWATT